MNISDKGLWFKLHKWSKTEEYSYLKSGKSVSLCPYFWKGLGALLFFVICTVALCVLLCLLLCVLVFLSGPYTGWWGFGSMSEFGEVLTIMGLIFTMIIGPFCGLPVAPNWIKAPLAKLFNKTLPEQPKPVSIVKEHYKAYKSKLCPMIKLEDNNE